MLTVKPIKIERLKPWAMNPRHNDQAVDAVARSIRKFGFNVPILCDKSLRIIAGHTRYKAAKCLGIKELPAIVLDLNEHQRQLFAIAENKTHEMADWNTGKLREILAQYNKDDLDIQALGLSIEEFRRLVDPAHKDDEITYENHPTARTTPGKLIALGRHKLLCADSRYRTSIKRITSGRRVDHVFAGPPYFNQREYSQWGQYSDHIRDMRRIIENCYASLNFGGVMVWNIANGSYTHHAHVVHHAQLIEEAGFQFLDMIIWVKSGANYGIARHTHIKRNRHYFPVPKWEALLVYQKPGKMAQMTPDAARYMWEHHTDVWEIPPVTNQVKTYGHPAVCPVEIPYRSIMAYTGADGIIFEPFGGSGTTLIAAEKAGRTALLIEKNPLYCDRIVARWEQWTSEKAQYPGN